MSNIWFPIKESLDTILTDEKITENHGWYKNNKQSSGSFNVVDTYTYGPEKRSVRYSLNPHYYIERTSDAEGRTLILGSNRMKYSPKMIKTHKNNEKNWRLASEHNLSPHLFYYGYYKNGTTRLTQRQPSGNSLERVFDHIHLCIISEGYDMDLASFYSNGKNRKYATPPQGWTEIESQSNPGTYYWHNALTNKTKLIPDKFRILTDGDKIIADQLVKLLQKTSTIMNTVCFDLKSANSVINIRRDIVSNEKIYEVKLIDWDADWCVSYNMLKSKKDASLAKLSGLISTVFMANQFLKYSNWNIFQSYFAEKQYTNLMKKGDSFYRQPLLASLKTMFCSRMKADEDIAYETMTMHYQKDEINHIIRGDTRNFKKKCNSIYDELWKRCLLLIHGPTPALIQGGKKTKKRKKKRKKRKSKKLLK